MADALDFRVKAGGVPLLGAGGSFSVIARDVAGAVRAAPAVVELADGVYRITPTTGDAEAGTVVHIDCGAGREPRRWTFAICKPDLSNQFWAVHVENPDGSAWSGAAPTVGSYRDGSGPRTPPALTAVEGAWLWVARPSTADIAADVEIVIIGPAGSAQPDWLGSTSPIANSGALPGGGWLPGTPAPVPDGTAPYTFGRMAYTRQLKALLPPGTLYRLEPSSTLSRTLEACADELTRVDGRGADLINESDPRTATETLLDWARNLGLPDEQVPELPNTPEGLRVAVTQKLVSRGGQNLAFFERLSAACGYPLVSLDRFVSQILRVGARVGDRLYGELYAYTIRLNVAAPTVGALSHADFERVIRRATHAHIRVMFTYA